MSLKIHFLHSHLDCFPPNLGTDSDEYSGRFYRGFSAMENINAGKSSQIILADYCWKLTEELSVASCRRMHCE